MGNMVHVRQMAERGGREHWNLISFCLLPKFQETQEEGSSVRYLLRACQESLCETL